MANAEPSFHFFTLLTKDDQYARMRESLHEVGFHEGNALFTVLDNRGGNAHEPYSAITKAVREAQAPYVVFCHQDLVFYKGPDELLQALRELDRVDPAWAVAGNTGHMPNLNVAVCLDDPGGSQDQGVRPAKVITLDENFLVIKRSSGVGCSPELSGFHLYATDLCLNAYMRGFSAYVIEYRLAHMTSSLDYVGLHRLARPFRQVWRKRIRSAVVVTPSMTLVFSRVPFLFAFANRVGMHDRILKRFRVVRTLEYLLRHQRPTWLPSAEYDPDDPRKPVLSPGVQALDGLIQRLSRK